MLYASDFRRIARETLRGKWTLSVVTGLVAVLLGAISYGQGSSSGGNGGEHQNLISINIDPTFNMFFTGLASLIVIWAIITFIIGGATELGYCRFNKNLINNTEPRFNDLFSRYDMIGKAFGLRVITLMFILLWSVLLVIPGIIAALRYSMAFYIMDDDPSLGIMEAIDQSKEMMMGNKFRLFCLFLSFLGWAILCTFTLGIGMLWLGPYMNASFAAFYLEISSKRSMIYD
jgi:uncharacterized membrane protein